jgi:glutaminyl-peptide cyclotransferase
MPIFFKSPGKFEVIQQMKRIGTPASGIVLLVYILGSNFGFCGKNIPEFDGQHALEYLQKQCDFGPRVPGSEASKNCLLFLEKELQQSADKVVRQDFQYHDQVRNKYINMTNLIAAFNVKSSQRMFLAAHWDSRPLADRDPVVENRDKPVPGANDGASGVAVLLELARCFQAARPEIGVDIILFDGEDYGREGHLEDYFLGSRYFARVMHNYRPRYGILLDMIGDAQLSIPIEGFSQEYLPHIVRKIWNTAASLGIYQFNNESGDYVNDDHRMLIDQGIPCIDIIDFNYPDASQRYWHTLADTPDKCSDESLQAVGTVLLHVIYNERQ